MQSGNKFDMRREYNWNIWANAESSATWADSRKSMAKRIECLFCHRWKGARYNTINWSYVIQFALSVRTTFYLYVSHVTNNGMDEMFRSHQLDLEPSHLRAFDADVRVRKSSQKADPCYTGYSDWNQRCGAEKLAPNLAAHSNLYMPLSRRCIFCTHSWH